MKTVMGSVMCAVCAGMIWAADPPQASQPAPPPDPAAPTAPVTPTVPSDPLASVKPNAQGEKILGGAPVDPNAYVIGAEDVLAISVWHEAELTRPQVVVRPDGKITLPLVGELTAAGLTPAQLTAAITAGLKKFMLSPDVNVSVQAVNSKKYYIQGEVLRPGPYPLVVPTTVMEGLANAGGFKDFANLRKITILRGSDRLKFNYKEVRAGKHLEQNILLQPGDQILVP